MQEEGENGAGLSTAQRAGVGVGSAVGGLLLLSALGYIFRWRLKKLWAKHIDGVDIDQLEARKVGACPAGLASIRMMQRWYPQQYQCSRVLSQQACITHHCQTAPSASAAKSCARLLHAPYDIVSCATCRHSVQPSPPSALFATHA